MRKVILAFGMVAIVAAAQPAGAIDNWFSGHLSAQAARIAWIHVLPPL
jgi:hypothetical protein